MNNYQQKIQALVEQGKLKIGDVAIATVLHDDWCKQLRGIGDCNCNPEIRLGQMPLNPDLERRKELYKLGQEPVNTNALFCEVCGHRQGLQPDVRTEELTTWCNTCQRVRTFKRLEI